MSAFDYGGRNININENQQGTLHTTLNLPCVTGYSSDNPGLHDIHCVIHLATWEVSGRYPRRFMSLRTQLC